MNDFFYSELKKCVEEIRNLDRKEVDGEGKNPLSENDQALIDTMDTILEYRRIAERDGLLALEEVSYETKDKLPNGEYLADIVLLLVDGFDAEEIEDIALLRYCTSKLSDYAALQYLMMLAGILYIRKDLTKRVMIHKLKYILPEEIMEMYERQEEEKEALEKQKDNLWDPYEDIDLSHLGELCEGNIAMDPSDNFYEAAKLADKAFLSFDDRAIQRILRDVVFSDLALAMTALSGEARRKIFNNLSRRAAFLVGEDMKDSDAKDSGETVIKILSVIDCLVEIGELEFRDADLEEGFAEFFQKDEKYYDKLEDFDIFVGENK